MMLRPSLVPCLLMALTLSPVALPAQDPTSDKAVQTILREQELAIGRVRELRTSIVRLKTKMEREGRDRAAELLGQAALRLDELRLEDQMSDIRERVRTGQAFASLTKTAEVVEAIQSLLNLLMEKEGTNSELEQKLKEFERAEQALSDIRNEQQDIKEKTDALRNALTAEQRAAILSQLASLRNLKSAQERNARDLREQFTDPANRIAAAKNAIDQLQKTISELEQQAQALDAPQNALPLSRAAEQAEALAEKANRIDQTAEALSALDEAERALAAIQSRLAQSRTPEDGQTALGEREAAALERAKNRARAAATEAKEAAASLEDAATARQEAAKGTEDPTGKASPSRRKGPRRTGQPGTGCGRGR